MGSFPQFPLWIAGLVALSVIARNLWPIFFDKTIPEIWRHRRSKIVIVEFGKEKGLKALRKLDISNWVSLAVALALLVVVGAQLFRQSRDALAIRRLESEIAALEADKAGLQNQLTESQLDLENQAINFQGGPTWKTVSRLLEEIAISPEESDPRTYGNLRYEYTFQINSGRVHTYSRSGDPDTTVFLETRIDVDDACWYHLNPQTGVREQRIARAIDPYLAEVNRFTIGTNTILHINHRITITPDATAQYLSQEIDRISGADRVARSVNYELCDANRTPIDSQITMLLEQWNNNE